MTSNVTDINEYRKSKEASGPDPSILRTWTDRMLETRHEMLGWIEAGHTDLIDMTQAIPRMSFPDGYDPDSHAADNRALIEAEMRRRGVKVPSA